jgi:hypothetical protein
MKLHTIVALAFVSCLYNVCEAAPVIAVDIKPLAKLVDGQLYPQQLELANTIMELREFLETHLVKVNSVLTQ